MQLHPQVKIEFDYELGEAELNSLSRTERNIRWESYYAQLRLELAWEFMKHCVLPRDSADFSHLGSRQRYTHDIPLNKTNFRNSVAYLAENGSSGMTAGSQFDSLGLDDMTEALEQVLSMPLVNTGAYGVDLQDHLDEYYVNGLTTPEQCAEKLQDRVSIWLHES